MDQGDGRSLYPFSLSYVPLPGRPRHQQGPDPSETALRRNLLLAAPSGVLRRRWLSSLARKIGSTQLRPSSTWGEREDGADAVDRPKRRFMELGALQAGLEKTRFLGRSIPRLPPARAEFWEAKSSLQMVRDLYDGYASDPLSCQPLHGEQGLPCFLALALVAMHHSEAWSRMSSSKSGCDMLMDRLHSTNFHPSATAGQLIIGKNAQLEPPYTRCLVDHGKVVDSGRFGRWAIGHGSGKQYWELTSVPLERLGMVDCWFQRRIISVSTRSPCPPCPPCPSATSATSALVFGLTAACLLRVAPARRARQPGQPGAPEAMAWERLQGVEEPLQTLVFPEEEGARCVAVVKGEVAQKEDVSVRVHSECFLGDALGSTRCQCGPQLRSFIESVLGSSCHPCGILLYLQGQEGKGIGLSNKLRAYVLQDTEGLNEAEANLRLGFPPDQRKYQAARTALEFLEVKSVVLYTASPRKISFLSDFVSGDRGTPFSSRPPSSSGHEELATMRRTNLEKFLPQNRPMDTTFQRIWGRAEPPMYTGEVAKHSPMMCTSAGVLRGRSMKSDEFMSQYLEKQAVIEFLLHRKQGRLEELKTSALHESKPEARHQEQTQAAKQSQVEKEVKIVTGCSFQLLAWTENLKFQEDILRNEQWSGGAIFARANVDDPSFELAVSLQDCPESHPIIIGIAPPDADLSQANFFGSCGGVFMCLGGSASEGRLGAMGAPGGPFIQGFGQRQRPDLPKGHRGCQVQINFTEAVDTAGQLLGHVCFMVTDERGRYHQHVPKFRRQIEGGIGWLPCILLCNPDTSVQVQLPVVDVQDRLVLDAAEHCRQLRQALSEKQRSHSIRAVKQRQRQLQDEEQRQLLREQQQLLEDQKQQLQEHQRILEEKELELQKQAKQMMEDREVAKRWEELAEFRHQQLLLEEAQMLQLQEIDDQERLEQGVDAFAEQHSSYAQCLQHFAQDFRDGEDERLKSESLEEKLKSSQLRHQAELKNLKDCILPLRPGSSRCCLFAESPAAPAVRGQGVLWGSVPLRPRLQDAEAQAIPARADSGLQTDADAQVLALEKELRHREGEEKRLEKEIQRLEEEVSEKAQLQEQFNSAECQLQTPEYLAHAELKQAYADLRDLDSAVRLQEDRAESVSKSCEQRVEMVREQSQQLMEQTRIQASQSASDHALELRRSSALQEELCSAQLDISALREQLESCTEELQLCQQEAGVEQSHLRAALDAQLQHTEEQSSHFQKEHRMRDSVASYMRDSWRRSELQPALDQAKALRQALAEDQRHAEALEFENHAVLLEVAQKQAALSFCSTEVALARAEVTAWKRGNGELAAKLEREEWRTLHEEALQEENRFLEASQSTDGTQERLSATVLQQLLKAAESAVQGEMQQQANSLQQELKMLRSQAASLQSSLQSNARLVGAGATSTVDTMTPSFGSMAFSAPSLNDVHPDKE
eukprot:s1596_g12.t1